MTGPVVLGLIGGAIVLASLVASVVVLTPERYRLHKLTNFLSSDADLPAMVRVQGRITLLAAFGGTVQLVALLWQANR